MQSVSSRWTERHRKYIQSEREEELGTCEDRADKISIQQEREYKRIGKKCQDEIASCQKQEYEKLADDSVSDDINALLLPSTSQSSSDPPEDLAASLGLTGVARVFFQDSIQLEREKRMKAVREAQLYRDLAEKMRREKRNIVSGMNEKIELVRDFWRNNIKEGTSRAGTMVKKALLKKN